MIHIVSNKSDFCIELSPNRSETLRSVYIIVGLLLCLFIPIGLVFSLLGAWPVFGFMGIELGLLYFAFRCNQKDSRAYERLSLNNNSLVVERHNPWRGYESWTFQPQWLQVKLDHLNEHEANLTLNSKGKHLAFGIYLTSNEKSDVADLLLTALKRVSFLHS
jgi:uncharacterized membrane protein